MARTIITLGMVCALIGCDSPDTANNVIVDRASNNATSNNGSPSNNSSASNGTSGSNQQSTGNGCSETGVVTFDTTDDVTITADFHPASSADRGAVVLLHMIPPNWDRSSYPLRVRTALQDLDLNVLNIDRRGAGDSTGTARDAYEGAATSLDVEAAVAFLLDEARSCAVDGAKLMLVGASNGTTSVYDYTAARVNMELPAPAAMVWLSPGTYTVAQNALADHPLSELPLLIVHPDNEPWSTQLAAVPEAWKVVEIASGQHGTQNFDDGALEAIQLPEILSWAERHIAPQ